MSHLNNILFQLDTLRMRTATHLTQSRKLITDMIPEARTTPRFFKRALLSFVGDLASSIFGIASEKSVRTLAGLCMDNKLKNRILWNDILLH